nr:hypothetical protein [Alphaproteobacteria bacterium]
MLNLDQNFLAKSQNVFVQKPLVSLADVRQKVQSDMSLAPTQKRDIISAMNRVEAGSGRPLAEIKAGAAEARKLLAGLTPAGLKVSDKTFSNIKSSFALAVRLHGVKIVPVTKRIPVAPEWQALLDQVKTIYLRQGLYRLATFCTVMAIPPHNVSSDTLRGLYKALEGEELVKQPRTILKITITSWNKCYREIPGWPRLLLSSPFKTAPTTIALDKFPAEFQKEIQEWARGLLKPDILDEAAVDRPLSQTTVEHRILQIRQLASHLVNSGRIKIEEIASIAVLLKPELFKEGMRCFLARHEGRSTTRIYNLANSLRHIAKNHCGFSEDDLALLKQTCKRLDPGGRRQMTPKNRQLLQQFDAAENVSQLLCYPEQQAAMAIKDKNTKRAAKRFERAVVMDLLLHCGLRSGTLRSLRITDFDFKADAREESVFLYIPAEDTKTNRPMEFELPKDTAQRLQKFIHDY